MIDFEMLQRKQELYGTNLTYKEEYIIEKYSDGTIAEYMNRYLLGDGIEVNDDNTPPLNLH